MDIKLLLVKAITLIYLNGKITDPNRDAITLSKEVIELIKPKKGLMSTEFNKVDPEKELKETLLHMINQPAGTKFDENELKQRFRLNVGDDDRLFNALVDGLFFEEKDEETYLKTFKQQEHAIRTAINKDKLGKILKQFSYNAEFNAENINYATFIGEIQQAIAPFQSLGSNDDTGMNHPGIVSNTDLNDNTSIEDVLSRTIDELDTKGVITTPYQGLNRMLGQHRGIRRGELGVITALTHNYKSGLTMDIFMGCALFNKPYMRDPKKKPLNLRISFENTVQQDFKHMYPKLKEYVDKEKVDITKVNIEEAGAFIMDILGKNGYHNRIIHIDPSDFTFYDLFKIIDGFEKQGYEIHLLTIDYLNMMSKAGCVNETAGENVRDLFRRVRNYCLKKGIAIITPHQFSSEARKVERNEPRNFVKTVTGKGFYDSSSRLEQELDLEVSIHIVEFNNESYLTMQRGKHRGVVTPIKHQYTVYKFEEIGGLPFDIETEDMSRTIIGGDVASDPNGGASDWLETVL